MSPEMPLITLPHAVAGVMVLSLNAYVLLAGADFGGGVWDLFARGPRREQQRSAIADAIGPIWEANHVWLILVVVLLFSCFPRAFSHLSTALHIPITLMLVGIVLRGSAFTFRSYDRQTDAVQRRWGRVFAIASVVTPVLLGICVGAVASGAVPLVPIDGTRTFTRGVRASVDHAVFLSVGVLALALFAHLAAVYLAWERREPELKQDFRARALVSAIAVFVAGTLTIVLARADAPLVYDGLTRGPRPSACMAPRRRRPHGRVGALAPPLAAGRDRGGRTGHVSAVGLGVVAVSLARAAIAHHHRARRAAHHAAARARRAGGGDGDPAAVIRVPVPNLQGAGDRVQAD
jgi:hypothetical protein